MGQIEHEAMDRERERKQELEQLRVDLAQFSEEMGLPPGIRPAPGELRRLFAELERLRSLLSSGQCVDLAKVTDAEIGSAVSAHPVTNAEEGASVRAALLELAEVKL